MKHLFKDNDGKDMPLNLLLSIPAAGQRNDVPAVPDDGLQPEYTDASSLHQNSGCNVFEGFYKSITRKLEE